MAAQADGFYNKPADQVLIVVEPSPKLSPTTLATTGVLAPSRWHC